MSSGDLAVQYAKLTEWLLARRVIPEDYARLLPGVEAKVQEALAEAVADEAARALVAQHREAVTYFAARDIYEALAKSKEGQVKTLLGGHVNPATAKWKAVLDAYRRRHLGWASEARALIQNASYEIPALKKHAAACERQVAECTQRQTELTRLETNAKGRYEALLRELGIEGFDPRRELLAIAAAELPKIHAELATLLKRSGSALADYYTAYAQHAAGGSAGSAEGAVPLLRAVATLGESARVEEVEKQVPALRAMRQSARACSADVASPPGVEASGSSRTAERPADEVIAANGAGIDAGTGVGGGGSIDWGGSGGGDAGGGGGIIWDFEVVEGAGASDGAPHGDSTGIDWGIEVAAGGEALDAAANDTSGIDWTALSMEGLELRDQGREASAGCVEDAAGGRDAAGGDLLGDASARELLYQEVAEVDAFLRERCAELGPGGAGGQVDGGPADAEKTLQEVQALAGVTGMAEELLAGRRTQRMLMLRSSARYLDQAVKRVEVAKAQWGKPGVQRSALDKAKAEQAEEARRARAEIEEIRSATRKAQRDLEAELSGHFKASVKIVGDIAQM